MIQILVSLLFFLFAVSFDSITTGLSYGVNRVKIRPLAYIWLLGMPSIFLTFANGMSEQLTKHIPGEFFSIISFLLFFLLAFMRFLESLIRRTMEKHPGFIGNLRCSFKQMHILFTIYFSPEDANTEDEEILTAKEAFPLSLALSLDSIVVGTAFHLVSVHWLFLFGFSLLVNGFCFLLGYSAGYFLRTHAHIDLSWLSALFLFLLALLSLFL